MAKNVGYDVTLNVTGVSRDNKPLVEHSFDVCFLAKKMQIEMALEKAKKILRKEMYRCEKARVEIREKPLGKQERFIPSQPRTIHLNPAL